MVCKMKTSHPLLIFKMKRTNLDLAMNKCKAGTRKGSGFFRVPSPLFLGFKHNEERDVAVGSFCCLHRE